jgi:hypothetical protein
MLRIIHSLWLIATVGFWGQLLRDSDRQYFLPAPGLGVFAVYLSLG